MFSLPFFERLFRFDEYYAIRSIWHYTERLGEGVSEIYGFPEEAACMIRVRRLDHQSLEQDAHDVFVPGSVPEHPVVVNAVEDVIVLLRLVHGPVIEPVDVGHNEVVLLHLLVALHALIDVPHDHSKILASFVFEPLELDRQHITDILERMLAD